MWSFGCRQDKIRKPRFPFALELISYPYRKYIFQYFLLLNTFWKFNGIFKPLYTRNFRWYEIIFYDMKLPYGAAGRVIIWTPLLSTPVESTPESSPVKICSVKSLPRETRLDFLPPRQYCITYFTLGKILDYW